MRLYIPASAESPQNPEEHPILMESCLLAEEYREICVKELK